MKKQLLISALVLAGIIIILVIFGLYYLNQTESVTVRSGKFFDESGKELGTCKVESVLKRMADVTQDTVYYYTPDKMLLGSCDSPGWCTNSETSEPKICTSPDLQISCGINKASRFGAQQKYDCMLEGQPE